LIDLNIGQGEMPGGMIVDWIRAHRLAENVNYKQQSILVSASKLKLIQHYERKVKKVVEQGIHRQTIQNGGYSSTWV
jgi:hypothetical protein